MTTEAQQLLEAAFARKLDLDAVDAGQGIGASGEDGKQVSDNDTGTTQGAPAAQDDEQPGTPIASKSGGYTIPFERLTEARSQRDAAQAEVQSLREQLAQLTATQAANLAQAQQEAAARAAAGMEQTNADKALEQAQSLVQQGVDPSVFGDFSEEAMAKGVQSLVQSAVAAAVKPFQDREDARQQAESQQVQRTAEQQHYDTITGAHPDASDVAESKEFADWIKGQPSYARDAINQTLQAGTATQVVEVLSQFKQAYGRTSDADPTAAAVAAAKSRANGVPPVSLSDVPGLSPAGSSDIERVNAMAGDPAQLMDYMMSLPPKQRDRLMNQL